MLNSLLEAHVCVYHNAGQEAEHCFLFKLVSSPLLYMRLSALLQITVVAACIADASIGLYMFLTWA